MSKATDNFKLFKNKPYELEKKLILIFKNKDLKIKKIKLLKEKLIIKNQYKVSVLLFLKNNSRKKVSLEIHDNEDYFKKNIFALTKLRSEIEPAVLFGIIPEMKIIVREYLEGDFFFNLILKKRLDKKLLFLAIEEMAKYLSFLHNQKTKPAPRFLTKRLNEKIEDIILKRTLEFIGPKLKYLENPIKKNLKALLERMKSLDRKNRICLIHGDYQIANFVFKKGQKISIMDFDTLEIGNPARDLGRFLFQMSYLMKLSNYPLKEIERAENLFLKIYFRQKKLRLYPDLKTNIDLHKAEMIQYMVLGRMWEKRMPPKREIKEIEDLLVKQAKLLNL